MQSDLHYGSALLNHLVDRRESRPRIGSQRRCSLQLQQQASCNLPLLCDSLPTRWRGCHTVLVSPSCSHVGKTPGMLTRKYCRCSPSSSCSKELLCPLSCPSALLLPNSLRVGVEPFVRRAWGRDMFAFLPATERGYGISRPGECKIRLPPRVPLAPAEENGRGDGVGGNVAGREPVILKFARARCFPRKQPCTCMAVSYWSSTSVKAQSAATMEGLCAQA